MSIFKRKSKPAKEVKATPKKDVAGQAPMKAYKPRHMADAALHGNRNQDVRNSAYSQQFYNHPKARSEEIFSTSQPPSMAGSQYGSMPRQNTDYLYQTRGRSGGYDNTMPFARGRGKADLGKEPGNMTKYYSSDSGYESAGAQSALQSRVPSLQNLQDSKQLSSTKAAHNFIPELRLGEEPLDHMSGIERVPTEEVKRQSQEGILKNGGNVSPVDFGHEAHMATSSKQTASVSKKTCFEESLEPLPASDQAEYQRELSSVPPVKSTVDKSTVETSTQHIPATDIAVNFASREQEENLVSTARSLQLSPHTFEALHLAYQPKGGERHDHVLRGISHNTTSTTTSRRSSLPPLSILEGLKVNKKGKILDEEGDQIGELVDGDLLDCVRQKANEKGAVIDEYGRVVGTVRTVPSMGDIPTNPLASSHSRIEPQLVPSMQLAEASRPNISLQTDNDTKAGGEFSRSGSNPIAVRPEEASIRSNAPSSPARQIQDEAKPATQLDDANSQTPAMVHADEPQHLGPAMSGDQPIHEHLQRPSRSASERSFSELGRSYARPPMSSVPENNVPEDDILPVESADLFAYKGEIPLTDARLPSRSPVDLSFPKTALGGHPGSNFFPQGMPGQLSPTGRMSMGSRRATTHYTGGSSGNNLNPKLAMMNNSSRRSPLSSHETSPKRSETGTDSISDDMPTMRPPHVRTPSMRSTATTVEKPRTYFTHGGKITVDNSVAKPEPAATTQAAEPDQEKVAEKKNGRFSMGFGRKK